MTKSDAINLARHDAEPWRANLLKWLEAKIREVTRENLRNNYEQNNNVCALESGTEITLHEFAQMRKSKYQNISIDEIAKTYAMLLFYKRAQIVVNGESLNVPQLPKYKEKIDQQFYWRGKKVRIIGGVYKTDDPCRRTWSGYYAYYKGRLLKGNILDHGRGDLSCSNFAYHLFLDDENEKWKLSTNKEDVEDLHLLIEYVYDTITEPYLTEADKESQYIELKELTESIEELVNGKKNSKRDKSNKMQIGTVTPKHSGRRQVMTNHYDQNGEYIPGSDEPMARRSNEGKIKFDFQELNGTTLGLVEKGPKGRIDWKFNKNNSWIAKFQNDKRVIAPLLVVFDRIYRNASIQEMFPTKDINKVLEEAGEHLHGTEDQYE